MKKLLVMAASLALIITLSVTGTIAFKSVGGGDGKSRTLRGESNVSTFADTGKSGTNAEPTVNPSPEPTDGLIKQTIWKRSDNSTPTSTTNLTVITKEKPDTTQLLPSPGSDDCTPAAENWTMWNVGGLDRIVTVTNNSPAASDVSAQANASATIPSGISLYVRTIFAFENPNNIVDDLILLNYNANENVGIWTPVNGNATIDDKPYKLFVYTYKNALAPGDTTPPSLKQVVLKAAATNEDVAVLNGGFEMKVVSEAVEVSAETSAFSTVTATSNPWVGTYNASTASISNYPPNAMRLKIESHSGCAAVAFCVLIPCPSILSDEKRNQNEQRTKSRN